MSRLDPFERAKVALSAGQILKVAAAGVTTVQILEGGPLGTTTVTNQAQDFGPYGVNARIIVECVSGVADYQLADYQATLTAAEVQTVQALANSGTVQLADGSVYALSEASPVVTLTASGTAFTGACEFRGINVRAISGTPQTVTVYDNTSASGTPIATFTVSALGYFYWDGNMTTPGVGNGARRVNSTGCHVVISGGTSRTIDVDVSGV